MTTLYTIGHSTHSMERLIDLLCDHGVTAVADIRSSPYSQYNPQFSRDALEASLRSVGLTYVFLGRELVPSAVAGALQRRAIITGGQQARVLMLQTAFGDPID